MPPPAAVSPHTIYAVVDKLLYKMAGARANAKAMVDAKQIPKWQFEFTGAFYPVEDVGAMPAVNYTKFLRPLGVNKLNTTLSLAGYNAAASSFQFDFGNQVVKQDLMGVDTTEITGRVSTGTVTFRNTSVATKNWIEMAREGVKVPLLLTQAIVLFQDTSLVYVSALADFFGAAYKVGDRDGRLVELLLFAGAVYFAVCFAASLLVRRYQKKLNAHVAH